MAVVGWIGLGNMGGPMSANLVKAGHDVRGFDLSPQALAAAESSGVHTVGSIAEAVDGAEVVFTMLPKGEHARAVYLSEDGILAHASTDTLLVGSSTIDIESAQALHDAAAAAGFRFVDAPVSGSVSAVEAGGLLVMAGGEPDAVDAASAVLGAAALVTASAGAAVSAPPPSQRRCHSSEPSGENFNRSTSPSTPTVWPVT